MKLKTGKEEIVYLLTRVIEKYESQHNVQVVRNSNRKNYEGVAKELSEISNELPNTAESLQHEVYPPDLNPRKLDYPFRKYDITGNQVKDAYFNQIVSKPRAFLVDACYIYLYGVGRQGFELHPQDPQLMQDESNSAHGLQEATPTASVYDSAGSPNRKRLVTALFITGIVAIAGFLLMLFKSNQANNALKVLKQDMKILPYKPTQAEVDSLEGIWLCYTGSPQARISDSNRFHKVVANVVDVKYKNGYFVFDRYGASFDHIGYMQFEAPWLVSIHSHVKNNIDSIESPRHSLMRLDMEAPYISVISASWSFDVGTRNNVIGIREVYTKLGTGGRIEEILNTPENASCRCKIVKWYQGDQEKKFYLRNENLTTLPSEQLKLLLDENSILLRVPQDGLVIGDSTTTNE